MVVANTMPILSARLALPIFMTILMAILAIPNSMSIQSISKAMAKLE